MTEKQGQGEWVRVRDSGEFELTEFELAGFYCNYINFDKILFLNTGNLLVKPFMCYCFNNFLHFHFDIFKL